MRRKNLLDLFRAVSAVRSDYPDIELRVAGTVQDQNYFESLLQYVGANHLQSAVTFLGQLSQPSLLLEYAQCSLVASASHEETAGMVFQQAMAAGRPVLGTCVGGVPDIVENERTGILVPAGDVGQLAHGLRRLLDSASLRDRMGRAGRQLALDRFTTDVVVAQTLDVYRRIAARPSKLSQEQGP